MFAEQPSASHFANLDTGTFDARGTPLKWKDAPVHDFGPETVQFDPRGMRHLHPPPPTGVHPRLYLSPEDLPDLRWHFEQSESGQLMWKYILCWTGTMKSRYNPKASYTTPDYWNGWSGWVHGPVPLMGLNEVNGVYKRLVAGDETVSSLNENWWGCFSLEALRCLVEDDADGAHDLAAATITALHIAQKERAAERIKNNKSGPIDGPVGNNNLPHIYDLIYNYLTPAQQTEMHDELANCSWHAAQYGTFEAATSARSTWATFTGNILPVLGGSKILANTLAPFENIR